MLVEQGDLESTTGDSGAARRAYRASLGIAERLTAQDPGNAGWQRNLIVSHAKLTKTLLSQGDPAARTHARHMQDQAQLWAKRVLPSPDRDAVLAYVNDLARAAEGAG